MAPKKGPQTREEMRLATLDHQLHVRRIDAWVSIVRTVIKSAAWVACVGFGYLGVKELAGKETIAKGMIDAVVNVTFSQAAAYAVAVIATGSAWQNRRVLRQTMEQHAAYVKKLEQGYDPNRTSSGLAPTGVPAAGDSDVG